MLSLQNILPHMALAFLGFFNNALPRALNEALLNGYE
jgi:hypothetical protein